tara:strand:+ start:1994 stop:3208 length:1215 start_codon:yes stop_codon:yes gene_type:complete
VNSNAITGKLGKVHPVCTLMVEERDQSPKATFDANDNRCRYHSTKAEGKQVPLLSQGMCPTAYLNLYPTLFGLHLNQDESQIKFDSKEHHIHCPLGTEGISFKVQRTKAKLGAIDRGKNLVRKLVNIVMPVEFFDKHTHIEAIDEGQGCPFGIKKGDSFYFNLDHTDEFCPAAFNSVYPLLGKEKNNFTAGCPDYRTNVRFSLATDSPQRDLEEHANCDSYSSKIKIVRVYGDFECPIELDCWYSIDEVIEACGIQCYASFHVAFPYLYTLYNGGQLGFLTNNRNSAGIACPNVSSLIKYIVSQDKGGHYKYSSQNTQSSCPRKIKIGDEVIINRFEKSIPFYYGLYDLYVSLKKIESIKDEQQLQTETQVTSMKGGIGLVWSILRSSEGTPKETNIEHLIAPS